VIVGACSAVAKDIPLYTIIVGNSARLIGYRFNPAVRAQIERTQWWKLSLTELGVAGNHLYAQVTTDCLVMFLSFFGER